MSNKNLKKRLPTIKTLAMMKMEKNFIALEKGYLRQPYFTLTIYDHFAHLQDEVKELYKAINENDIVNIKEELADISNLVDYMFEMTAMINSEETIKEDKKESIKKPSFDDIFNDLNELLRIYQANLPSTKQAITGLKNFIEIWEEKREG